MRSTPWYRLSTVFAVAGVLILAGCGEDTPTSEPEGSDDNPVSDPVLRTALEAVDAAREHIQETIYDNLDRDVIVDGDTVAASADLATLVALRAISVPGNERAGSVGDAETAPWFVSLIDTTHLVTKQGTQVATRYDVDLDPDGTIIVGEMNVSTVEFRNGGDSYYMGAVDIDSDAAIGAVFSDSASNASLELARIDSLLSMDSYTIYPRPTYAPRDTFWLPPDEMTEVVVDGETYYEFTRNTKEAGGEIVRYAASLFVQNTDYLDPVIPVVFDADERKTQRQAIFDAGEDIALFTGPDAAVREVRTTWGQEDPSLVALYRVEAAGDKVGIRWAEIDPDLIDGEVYPDTVIELGNGEVECQCPEGSWTQSDTKPCACLPEMLINGDDYLVIVNLGGGAITYPTAGHWTLERTNGTMLLSDELNDGSFDLGSTEVTMVQIDSFYIDGDTIVVDLGDNDHGIDPSKLSYLHDLVLDFPHGSDDLTWRIATQFLGEFDNELIFGDPVVDWVSAVADTSGE